MIMPAKCRFAHVFWLCVIRGNRGQNSGEQLIEEAPGCGSFVGLGGGGIAEVWVQFAGNGGARGMNMLWKTARYGVD